MDRCWQYQLKTKMIHDVHTLLKTSVVTVKSWTTIRHGNMEFTNGIFNVIKNKMNDSAILALIYTCGHIIIAMNVVYCMTGASIWEAGAVALIEPCINGVWFYVLHRIWIKYSERKTKHSK